MESVLASDQSSDKQPLTSTTESKMTPPRLVAPSSEMAGARRATAARGDENGDANPPRPWLWPRHTTHDGTRSDRREGWTRRETGGRRSRGRGRMRTRGFRKCASSIRLEKSCCVSTAARLLSMTRPGLLCVSIKQEFRSNRPRPEGGARRPPALRRQERKSARARNGKRQFYVRSNFRTFTCTG